VGGCFGERRHAQLHGGAPAGSELIELGELGGRCGEADLQAFDLTEPVVLLGLGNAVAEVVADLDQAGPLRRIGSKQGTTQATVLMDAAGSVGAAAVTKRDPAALEVAEELFPFLFGRGRYSSDGRSSRRRAMKARWPLMASSG
jgi:hypothetical protein